MPLVTAAGPTERPGPRRLVEHAPSKHEDASVAVVLPEQAVDDARIAPYPRIVDPSDARSFGCSAR
jgi:hypothetical protein